jgi:hypothetical protein
MRRNGIGRAHIAAGVAVAAVCLILPSLAQTPTDVLIRLVDRQNAGQLPRSVIIQSSFSSRGGFSTARVTASASTPAGAQRAARRRAYGELVHRFVSKRRDLDSQKANVSLALAGLKPSRESAVRQSRTKDGYLAVVEVKESDKALAADIRSVGLSSLRMATLLPEKIDGVPATSPKVETALVGELSKRGYRVYDWHFVSQERPLAALVSKTLSGNTNSGGELGTRLLANIVVIGRVDARFSQENEGIVSYIASTNLRVLKADTGQILLAKEYNEKGFGLDRPQAARKSLDALAAAVAAQLPAELNPRGSEHRVTVELVGGRPAQAAAAKDYLTGLAGVVAVQDIQSPSGVVFRVQFRDKPAALGAAVEQGGMYKVIEYTRFSP